MSIDRGFLSWGVFLILLGGIPLAVNQGWLDAAVVEGAWQLWPVVIIGIGISLVARRTPLEPLGGLVVAAILGIMMGSVFVAGLRVPALGGCAIGDGSGTAFPTENGSFGADAQVHVELSCGELGVTTAAGTGWSVAGRDDDGGGPDVDATADLGAAETVASLAVSVNAGSARVALPDASLSGSISANAGSIELCRSAEYESPGFADADARIELDASANAGSITLDPEGGCNG